YNPETEPYTLTISQRTPPPAGQAARQEQLVRVAIELYDTEGKGIPLQKSVHPQHAAPNLTHAEQTLDVAHVSFQPVRHLLGELWAPGTRENEWSDHRQPL
ncbi:aminopeptidase N, partial [Klebsiella pneumoniae]